MRFINLDGRACLEVLDTAVDIHTASQGKFGPEPSGVLCAWEAFSAWLESASLPDGEVYDSRRLRAPSPAPRQVFAVGLNFTDHARETGYDAPASMPPVFTKFDSALTGPYGNVSLSGDSVDWEVELVAVIGREATEVSEGDAWRYIAGVTVGQDLSDRAVQMAGPAPQFSLGKSFPGYGPTGPAMVTFDRSELLNDLVLRCWINEELVQEAQAGQMIHSVPQLLSHLSHVCTLFPGDLIFAGTPDGVGMGRVPARYLRPGDVVRSEVDGIGEMVHHML